MRRRSCIAANLRVDLIEIVVLHVIVSLVDPENFSQQIGTALLHAVAALILQCRVGHGKQQCIVLCPVSQNGLDGNAVFGNGVLDFQGAYVCLDHLLPKIIEVGRQHLVHVLHVDLYLEIMLHIVIDHLQQIYQRAGVIIGAVDGGHLLIYASALMRNFQ